MIPIELFKASISTLNAAPASFVYRCVSGLAAGSTASKPHEVVGIVSTQVSVAPLKQRVFGVDAGAGETLVLPSVTLDEVNAELLRVAVVTPPLKVIVSPPAQPLGER